MNGNVDGKKHRSLLEDIVLVMYVREFDFKIFEKAFWWDTRSKFVEKMGAVYMKRVY